MSKTVTVSGEFTMHFSHNVEVPDDFDVNCAHGSDDDAEFLKERMDMANFEEVINANGGGEWEINSWSPAKETA